MLHVGRFFLSSLLAAGFVGALAAPAAAQTGRVLTWQEFGGERAVTRPSQDAVMGFTLSTSVREVLVKGGERVEAGDLMIRGDDSADVAEANFQRARADTPLPRERAEAQYDLAQLELRRQLDAQSRGAANPLDVERATAAATTAKIDLDLAILNETLASLQADAAQSRVEKLHLRAPFDGIVDFVNVDTGQSVRDGEPVVRVVTVDPIHIDVPAPTGLSLGLGLAPGSPAWVLLQDDVKSRIFLARVTEVAPTADSGSGTRRVRVEMANTVGVVPGVNCWVRFTEPDEAWGNLIVDPSEPVASAEVESQR